jgi:hypothetical protein
MFQQRQLDYLNRSVMPIIKMAHDTNNNEIRDKLLARLPQMESDPDAQLAVSYLKSIRNADFSHPGETRGITVTEDNIGTLAKGDPVQMEKLKPYLGKTVDYSDQGGVIFKIGPYEAKHAGANKTYKSGGVIDEESKAFLMGQGLDPVSRNALANAKAGDSYSIQKNSAGDIVGVTVSRKQYKPASFWQSTGGLKAVMNNETNELEFKTAQDIVRDTEAAKREGRPVTYSPATQQEKANKAAAQVQDIQFGIGAVRKALDPLPDKFSDRFRVALQRLNEHKDPEGFMSAWAKTNWSDMMTPKEYEYFQQLTNLQERVMSMRVLLGMGQGAKDQRTAILSTLPNYMNPDKASAAAALNNVESTLKQLSRGATKGNLRAEGESPYREPKAKGKNPERLSATISYLKKKFPGRTEEEYRRAAEASLR